jgi:hypothetical protein
MAGTTGLAAGTAGPAKTSQNDFLRLEGRRDWPEKTQEPYSTLQALLGTVDLLSETAQDGWREEFPSMPRMESPRMNATSLG